MSQDLDCDAASLLMYRKRESDSMADGDEVDLEAAFTCGLELAEWERARGESEPSERVGLRPPPSRGAPPAPKAETVEPRAREKRADIWRDGCGSWACPSCCVVLGAELRRRLLKRLDGERAILVTLTIDRSKFASPVEAWRYIKRQKCIPRSIADFYGAHGLSGNGAWISKMELQRGGWPHWHCLLIVPEDLQLPRKGAFDEFWEHGFSNVRWRGGSVGYFTKYIVKDATPEDLHVLKTSGLPVKGVRWVTAARGFWGKGRRERVSEAPLEVRVFPDEDEGKGLDERVSRCDQSCTLVVMDAEGNAAPELFVFPVSRAELQRMLELGGAMHETEEPWRGGVWMVPRGVLSTIAALVDALPNSGR